MTAWQEALDPFAFGAAARCRVLLRPSRPVKQADYDECIKLLHKRHVIRFDDVGAVESALFNPKTAPTGQIVYEFCQSVDDSHDYLHSLELPRRTLAVIYIGAAAALPVAKDNGTLHELLPTPIASINDVYEWLCVFTGKLFLHFTTFYNNHKDNTILQSPRDPASDFIRPKPQRISSFALNDAHVPPQAPSPGPDRSSKFGLGTTSNSALERAKVQGHGRTLKFLGDLLLLAGFASDALKHYTDAVSIAKSSNDFLWQASATEGITVAILSLTHAGIPFAIPSILKAETTDLVDLFPIIYTTVLNLYNKSTTTPDQAPPIVIASAALRMSKFLAIVHNHGFNKEAMSLCMTGRLPSTAKRKAAYPPRAEVAAWAMRGYAETMDSLTLADKIHIYGGLAAVLALIGFERRRAFFLREILLALIPALVTARVADAAGKGIHPAATLALGSNAHTSVLTDLNMNANTLKSLLLDLCRAYHAPIPGDEPALSDCALQNTGWRYLRNQVLQDCAGCCEALSDFEGYLSFSVRGLELNNQMHRDEQIRVAAAIPRVTTAARRAGQKDFAIPYWDSWLIRDIIVEPSEVLPQLRPGSAKEEVFLHNAFAKLEQTVKSAIVEGEPFTVMITLQNPYAFDIEATKIELVVDGEISAESASCLIPADSTTSVSVTCVARSPIIIKGCQVSITGCCSSFYELRRAPSREEVNTWITTHQVNKIKPHQSGPLSTSFVVPVEMIPAMALLEVIEPTPTIQLLDGEKRSIVLKVRNRSHIPAEIEADYSDSTRSSLEHAVMTRKSAHEVYEFQYFLDHRASIEFEKSLSIAADSEEKVSVTLLGKRGVSMTELILSYGSPMLRKTPIPVNISWSACVEIISFDIIDAFMIIDLRNFYFRTLCITITYLQFNTQLDIAPGEQSRVLIPYEKISPRDDPIPRKHYIHTTENRTLFWAREGVLSSLEIHWSGHGRAGRVEERSILMTQRHLDLLLRNTPIKWEVFCQVDEMKSIDIPSDEIEGSEFIIMCRREKGDTGMKVWFIVTQAGNHRISFPGGEVLISTVDV